MGGWEQEVRLSKLCVFYKKRTAYEIRVGLVGSEMCIGDSVCVVSPVCGRAWPLIYYMVIGTQSSRRCCSPGTRVTSYELVIFPGHVRHVGRPVGARPDGRRSAGGGPKGSRPDGRRSAGAGPDVV